MVKGIVGFIKTRKKGKVTYYSIKIEDGEWYGMGSTNPESVGACVGAYVEFESTTNAAGFEQVDKDTLVVKDIDVEADSGNKGAAKARTSNNNRNAVINWHSCRNAAVEFVKAAAAAGALSLGKDGKMEQLQIIVNRLTVEMFYHATEVEETGDVPEEFQG